MAKCCNIPVGTFCVNGTLGTVTVWGYATITNGVMTVKYFDADGNEYVYADLIQMNCAPANPFTTTLVFNDDFVCNVDALIGHAVLTLSDYGGIQDGTVLKFNIGGVGVEVFVETPTLSVADPLSQEVTVVDATLMPHPITILVKIPIADCGEPLDTDGILDGFENLVHGYADTDNTGDTQVYAP